ncbi:MAG: COX15/CtaA family protein [Acidobacteriaceae bacterium]
MATLTDARSSSATHPPRGLTRFAWFVLGYNVLVILWGAVVRATGSGAGCGDHWPLCNGQIIPQDPRIATMIEFTHRAMTGGTIFAVLGLLIWTFRATPRGHLARIAAVASLILLINEAFLGAMLVKLGYVVQNQSMGRFIVLPIHLSNTLLYLAALALTASFLARDLTRNTARFVPGAIALSVLGLGASLLVGVSGSLAALGDTLFPAKSLAIAMSQDFSSTSPWLLRLRWVHPASAFVAGIFVLWLVVRGLAPTASARIRTLSFTVAGLLIFQILLGFIDVLLLAPTWMQIVHLLGANLYWIGLVLLASYFMLTKVDAMEKPARSI